ncbi:hypothetical protein [Kitasatospora kifunensis]|uniref:Hemophore-related protein n=1 Tax=Kitasatospora kifunensis TaxID=58351 RepID=A0A7W7R6W4_KITKI|nr:hypothetical protein [Kitasatospora kifunensis]MBB4926545.1 hypothetical protein [Kitasatospora kifunensis]
MPSYRKAGATLGALALGGTLLVAAAPAQAATSTPTGAPVSTPASGPTGDGAKGICKRLPKTEQRIQKALDRLNGPVTENGSVARLQQRVDNAKNAGQTAIYTYLNDRLTFRKSLIPTLTTRQSDLQSVATWCSSQGLANPSGSAQ